jgi:hypothetical protein
MTDPFTDKLRAAMDAYVVKFPGEMPDMRAISDRDYYALPEILNRAVLRGSAVTDADFLDGVTRPDVKDRAVL